MTKKEKKKIRIKEENFFNQIKMIIYNKKVIVNNYQAIKEMNDDKIIIDNWEINGTNLKINELNSYELIIKGFIQGVKKNEE